MAELMSLCESNGLKPSVDGIGAAHPAPSVPLHPQPVSVHGGRRVKKTGGISLSELQALNSGNAEEAKETSEC